MCVCGGGGYVFVHACVCVCVWVCTRIINLNRIKLRKINKAVLSINYNNQISKSTGAMF